jgi:pimeloyl-ACP methyl ester carboxylesterase
MPYAENTGAKIYYEEEGNGPPLVLLHGLTSNSRIAWRDGGYVAALKSDYRLILIDARGHGESDKPHDRAAYAWPTPVTDVVAVLDQLAIHQVHVLGYSMGGELCYGLAKYAPDRVASLLVGGMPAQANDFSMFEGVDGRDQSAFFAAFEAKLGVTFPAEAKARIATNDLQALTAFAQTRPSLENILPRITVPCLLFVGEADPWYAFVRDDARRIAHATFVSFPSLGHPEVLRHPELVLPAVRNFLREQR